MKRYNPSEIEPKWQAIWEEQHVNEVTIDPSKPKVYISGMFPYPSGAGMHTGHAFSYSIVDALARFHRQHGRNVLNPMGWDTFGLPAENYAIKTNTAPAIVTAENIANFKKQFKRMGVSIDWSREINTSDPEYYRWTQWVFTKLFERGLAYQKESLQWWCPVDKTVLANEQVEGGHCWRCGSQVEKKSMKQWFFKITEYADALLDEIPDLDWPQKIKTAQTNWIGRSLGAEVEFRLDGRDDVITVFTTRPDTLFGATFVVLAPEHELARKLAIGEYADRVDEYIKSAVKKSEIERTNDTKDKTGVFTGSYAINPATGEKVPVWVADYVLNGYGTGAIMAVPAHDERDNAFAEKFNLPIIQVIAPSLLDQENPPQAGKKDTDRKVVMCLIKHPTDGTYLTLRWNKFNWHNLVMGGIENGEDLEAAARREIQEETGYTDLELVDTLPTVMNSKFYAAHKDVNRNIFTRVLSFQLKSLAQVETSREEHEDFEAEWTKEQDLALLKPVSELPHILRWLGGENVMHSGEGVLINSGSFDGKSTSDVREEIVAWLKQQGTGRPKVSYKMRDWLISRQRYWGAPIPIIHCPEHGAVAVPEDQLPVVLPEVKDFVPKGNGKSALASVEDWVNTTCPTCGGAARRETDTMDGYACSSWYLLRYADPKNNQQAWDPEVVNYWSPVDYYVGGDHAVAHLLYVRFWTHVFKDMGLTDFKEPVKKLIYHGYINTEDGTKMSKSKGNVIDPLDVIEQGYGADALRTYLLFMGPIELDAAWDSRGIAGIYRFLNRVWVLAQEYQDSAKDFEANDVAVRRAQHKTVRKVTEDINRLSFNTAISSLMEYTNELYKLKVDGFSKEVWLEALQVMAQLIAPFAPHLSEELNNQLGRSELVQNLPWPVWDDSLIVEQTMTVIVQVNGKLRAKLVVAKDTDEAQIKQLALEDEHVASFVGDKKPAKVIYVPGRLVSIVV
jgi:leucyl-tRNA synthetase